jgi:hypothetical protein
MTKQERLAAIHNRTTRYEIVAILATGERFLLGYRIHQSAGELMNMAIDDDATRQRLVSLAGIVEGDSATYSRKDGWTFGNGKLRIGRTGRTERDAILEGELPRITVAAVAA